MTAATTSHQNPPIPQTWRLLVQHEVTEAIGDWAVATLTSHRQSDTPPWFGYDTRDDFGDGKTYEALVCWHPPDAQNSSWHSGVTVYEETDPTAAYSNPLQFPTIPPPAALIAKAATVGSKGFDTDTKLTSTSAAALKQAGYDFAIRYVTLGAEKPSDITLDEVNAIVAAGLGLMLVQHVRYPGWIPNGSLGAADGSHAVANAAAVGYPAGATLWCDLEGVYANAAQGDVSDYVNAWSAAVIVKGFQAGLYVGAGSILSGEELYKLPHTTRYWKSASNVPDVATRSYCMVQLYPTTTVAGVSIDIDVVREDHKGGYPMLAVTVA